MKLFLGGVRGGGTRSDADFLRYGGDSSCFLVEGQTGERLIIDAGTGLRAVEQRLADTAPECRSVCFLFSHYHLDHLAGLPHFQPLYTAGWTIELAARVFDELTIEDMASSFLHPPLWPLPLEDSAATKRFRILDDESMEGAIAYGDLQIRWCPLHHPGGSTAFRIDETVSGKALVVATDLEWGESSPEEQAWLEQLCRQPAPADLLVFDGQYARDGYERFRGWGHSTWQDGVALAQQAGIKRLLITHLGLDMDDAAADQRQKELHTAWSEADLARQGLLLEL